MKIGIEHHDRDFNVNLSSKEGSQPFLTIKGCRIVDGSKGQFVSWPAKKLESGKWWSHCWGSDLFNAAVLEAYTASKPAAKPKDEAWQARQPARQDEDIPFIVSLNEFDVRPSKERRLSRTEF